MSWPMPASRRSMDGVRTATISTLREIISKASQAGVEPQAYANRLIDGLVIGFSDGVGGIWRFGVCIATPLTTIWTLWKAQSTSPHLQHCDGALGLSTPY